MSTYIWGIPKIRGTPFGGPYNKDKSNLGSILGSPLFWETTILIDPAPWIRNRFKGSMPVFSIERYSGLYFEVLTYILDSNAQAL